MAKRSMESVDLICDKLFETLQHAAAARYTNTIAIFECVYILMFSEYNIENVDKKCPVAINAMIVKCVTILCDQREV